MSRNTKRSNTVSTSCLLLAVLAVPGLVRADSLDTVESLSQTQFIELTESLGAATHYKSVAPAEGLGTIGFDMGIEASSTDIDGATFDAASNGSFGSSELRLARLHVHKGLPFGLDVGASVSRILDTDITVIGGEIRYSLIDGSTMSPALALRASYSQLQGFSNVDVNSSALELTVSKGILMLTPYAGVGVVRTKAKPNDVGDLRSETVDQEKLYVGLTVNLGLAFTLEIDRTGDYRTYSAKAGIRF
jgi:hypothetical protein